MATPRKSTPAKKTAAKKAPAKKAAPAKQAAPAKKTAAKRSTPAKRSTTAKRSSTRAAQDGQHKPEPKPLRTIAVSAARELSQLIGQVPEGIVGVEKSEHGWRVLVEVVESHRIPETTDILAVYEVEVDNDGAVTGYRRMDRYVRGRIQE
ncbi:gas vesicle protein [Kribbella sp. NPDC050470]|uniref:gas vesicle protein GvpO n=1 Tax=unclassified Kribbella TaxID=2644121 RepID=UPI0037ADFF29